MAGVPKEILERAKYVSHQIRSNLPIQKLESEDERRRHERDLEILKKFQELNCERVDQVEQFLNYIRSIDDENGGDEDGNESVQKVAQRVEKEEEEEGMVF